MRLPPFELERFFAQWEFTAPYVACASDIEGYRLREVLDLADEETRRLWDDLRLGYTESLGHPRLRAEIAKLSELAEPDQVIVTSGAEEAIFLLANVLLGSGDHAIVTTPAYQSLHEVARATGAVVDLLPLDEGAGWALDLDRLRALVRPSTRLICINFPHNPTGALPDRVTFDAIVDIAREVGCHLLSDEVYRGLEHDPSDRLPAAASRYERAVSIGVMSKAYALAGLRIGWMATSDGALRERIASFKHYTTICNSAPSEILALAALRAGDRVLARSREMVLGNVACFERFLAAHRERFAWVRPRAGSVAFPRLLGPGSIDGFARDLVERTGVLVLPGTVFGDRLNHFRIGFGRTHLPEALARWERYLTS